MISEQINDDPIVEDERAIEVDALLSLVKGRATTNSSASEFRPGVVIGELVALADAGNTPLVLFPNQVGSAAVPARSVTDLHGAHIGNSRLRAHDG